MTELEILVDKLRELAARTNAVVVDQYLRSSDANTSNHFILSLENALELIEITKPLIIYITISRLDVVALIDSSIEEICDGEDDKEVAKAVCEAAKPLKSFDGKIDRVTFHFFVGYALHTVVESSDWLLSFEQALEVIAEKQEEDSEAALSVSEKFEQAHAEALAKKLVDEPAFSHGRTSFAKRLLLAHHMFPDEGDGVLNLVVGIAENLHWLKSTGFPLR